MQSFDDNNRLTNENEHLKKITQDYSHIKNIIDEIE